MEFSLEGSPFIELKDLLKICGLCDSGGEAKAAISEGQVTVDGQTETRKGCKIKSGQSVTFQKKTIQVID